MPILGRIIWPYVLKIHPSRQVTFFVFGVGSTGFNLIWLNTAMNILYWAQIPWIEKHRISDEPWPWNDPEKKDEWWALFWRTIWTSLFNQIVLGSVFQIISLAMNGMEVKQMMEVDELPDHKTFFL